MERITNIDYEVIKYNKDLGNNRLELNIKGKNTSILMRVERNAKKFQFLLLLDEFWFSYEISSWISLFVSFRMSSEVYILCELLRFNIGFDSFKKVCDNNDDFGDSLFNDNSICVASALVFQLFIQDVPLYIINKFRVILFLPIAQNVSLISLLYKAIYSYPIFIILVPL